MISGIDQNSAYSSLKSALVPSATLIDGRSEEDMLCFLAKFASVINFYDQDNQVQGNWVPFILKDPVFLTAMISRTNSKELYITFLNNCQTLNTCIADNNGTDPDTTAFISFSFNKLFDQIDQVYRYFRDWVYYMERSHIQYEFKRYVTTNIRDHYSQYFWALISLKEAMHKTRIVPGITAPFNPANEIYNYTEQIIWETGMGKAPYWEVLDMGHRITINTQPTDVLDILQKSGEIVFDFFEKCISYAAKEYSYLKQKKSSYPDTLLLRGFVDLLKQHQGQLNGISKKHLDFYYRDILQQEALPGSPDSAYMSATLAKPGMTFTLPANTLFNAGTDNQKKPVVFSNPGAVILNPGIITSLATLSVSQVTTGSTGIYMNTVPAPGTVQKDQQGNIIGFNTFGNTNNQGALVATGISFASPMFLLKEGARTITLTITCGKNIDNSIFNNAAFYFSTVNNWLQVMATPLPVPLEPTNVLVLQFQLDATQPPIEPFKKNPDLLETQWPLFKIQFQQVPDPANPPVITKLEIDVLVNGVKSLQLYNDYGSLSTKAPFPFMGPAPMKGANFIIGSSEIFSKPVKSLSVELDWNGVPKDFETYYLQYNQYLEGDMNIPPPAKPCWLTNLKNTIAGTKPAASKVKKPKAVFNNCCFTVAFQLLQDQLWAKIDLRNSGGCIADTGVGNVNLPPADTTMFSTTNSVLDTCSIYQYIPKDAIIPDVSLQSIPLKYTGQNTSGFLKMTLTGPDDGFGSLLYPAIVFQITLDNAQQIADALPPAFTTLTPIPFVPKVSSISAAYGASTTVIFTTSDSTYPIQCFLYTPFQNYKVYDACSGIAKYNYTFNGGKNTDTTGIPMFAPLNSSGCLFIGIEKLFAPAQLSLYFELARVYSLANTSQAASYTYLSTTGWKNLEVLADGTGDFSCSGIIKINIPPDIDYNGLQNQPGKCWLAISVSAPPQSYPQTIYCAANGFIACRTGQQQGASVTHLAAATISKTLSAVPHLATIQQPFPSFGGKVDETDWQMDLRVSNRIKTKGRACSTDDFFRIIIQSFPDVFYAKTVFNYTTNTNEVYLVKSFTGPEVTGAFTPLISACAEEKIRALLIAKSSCFISIGVSNFSFQFIRVTADLIVDQGNGTNEVAAQIGQQLNLFLSPWISSDSVQVAIDTEITAVQVAGFVAGLNGVLQVNNVRLQTWSDPSTDPSGVAYTTQVKPFRPSMLLVSFLDHNINCKAS
ncbi:hypothetical protein EWM62_06840 [Mucilaginibacter terrigena]|uniref:Baseplate protein J-like domain-containing protein n=1 Tax=Mucilaginibacter terrigena TaxID=2492395 RepID=A0A4Q5LQM1_9SPHI|nr:hypothetical protein [Mucilaginibacter terrigena]RYU91649.1 hypothetical protein EWM62_06840 [Mucilaginibacter terrigena]